MYKIIYFDSPEDATADSVIMEADSLEEARDNFTFIYPGAVIVDIKILN